MFAGMDQTHLTTVQVSVIEKSLHGNYSVVLNFNESRSTIWPGYNTCVLHCNIIMI